MRSVKYAPKILKTYKNGTGYEKICLCKQNKKRRFYIHRLVAAAFIPNKFNKNVVNHKDFNRLNNNFENLEWLTTNENVAYSSWNMKKCQNKRRISNSGEKYIYLNFGKYNVYIAQIKFYKRFSILEEAIKERNHALEILFDYYQNMNLRGNDISIK